MEKILIDDFNYPLPDERIAKYPLAERDSSKLLVYRGGEITEDYFRSIGTYLPEGSLLIYNNTRVIQARLIFHKESGARIEVFCLGPIDPLDYQLSLSSTEGCVWKCMIGNLKKWKTGKLALRVEKGDFCATLFAERLSTTGNTHEVRFSWDDPKVSFAELLDAMGELPIPPYLNRATEEKDKQTYQTVYSRIKGSVAAPTAGLHFTEKELSALRDKNVDLQYITLHVGAGTFKPVKSDTIEGHDMHTEFISVPKSVIQRIVDHLKSTDAPLIAVGTTSVRTLESLYYIGNKIAQNPNAHAEELVVHQWEPYDLTYTMTEVEALEQILAYLDRNGEENLVTATQILIAPGFQYRLVKVIVTNFHMPQSTLLLLVSAFVDGDSLEGPNWHRIYKYAMEHEFRFLSYGDSSILFSNKK